MFLAVKEAKKIEGGKRRPKSTTRNEAEGGSCPLDLLGVGSTRRLDPGQIGQKAANRARRRKRGQAQNQDQNQDRARKEKSRCAEIRRRHGSECT